MRHLDAQEWLEAQRIAGNPFAGELLDLVAAEPDAIDARDALGDLARLVPEEFMQGDRWRLVEWITDRLRVLDDVEDLLRVHAAEVKPANGFPISDAADHLELVFNSSRWQTFDL